MASEPIPTQLLASIPPFNELAPEHQQSLSRIAHVSSHTKGEEIFHEGDVPEFLYVVLEGRVVLEMHIPNRGRLRILTVEPYEVLGWSSIVDISRKRTVSARAVTAAKLLAIDAVKLRQACQDDPRLGFVIMHQVANVIAGRLIATRIQLLDMFANPPSEAAHG
jgi:CRP/FNR family cyclic AMP-dependent transcriptional regulator